MHLRNVLAEPPFRLAVKYLVTRFSSDVRRRAHWDAAPRPHYRVGLLAAADQARREGRDRIAAFEFGVAGGAGLITMARLATEVSRATGVEIRVYGFDTGHGLPDPGNDPRDFPDHWQAGDYPMDVAALRARLPGHAELVLGDVAETVPAFTQAEHPPVGFVAMDLDLYSATIAALQLLSAGRDNMLLHVPMYFDDIEDFAVHRFGGELAAIADFNAAHDDLKIDAWRGLPKKRPFPEAFWLRKMFVAHDLRGVARAAAAPPAHGRKILPLD